MIPFPWIEELTQKKNEMPKDPRYQIEWKMDEPMSRHTSFGIGGSAALYAVCHTVAALQMLLQTCQRANTPYIVLGNGTNVLFSDAPYPGVVIAMSGLRQVSVMGTEIVAEAGASLSTVAHAAENAALTGMECLYGIPGSCGGAVFMNAGAYGGEMRDIVLESTYLDTTDGSIHTLSKEAHAFGYRDSIYRHHPTWIVLSVKLSLQSGDKAAIHEQMEDYMQRRITKQPLDFPSAGSVFKRYPGRYTAQMIEEAGLKGVSVGGAQVSEKHAGFIINKGGATAKDVTTLVEQIRQTLHDKYGIWIECELIKLPK